MSIITRINKAEKRIVDLYNKLKNLPSGGGDVDSVLETKNKLITIPLGDLGVAIEDVTYEMVSDYINNLGIVVEKGENYYFEVIEFSQETTDGLVVIDLTNSQPTPQSLFQITDLTN